MSKRVSALVLAAALVLPGCGRQPPAPELARDEQLLVDTYVRLRLLEALHAESPDSVGAALGELRATLDTTAVRHALASLAQEPLRWERIYDAITRRLAELEESEPRVWWQMVSEDSGAAPPRRRGPSAPAPARDR